MSTSSQPEFGFSTVCLPAAVLTERLFGIATLTHVVSSAQTLIPTAQMEIAVSPRRKETLLTSRDQGAVIVTDKRTHPPCDEASAILSTAYDGGRWLKHNALDRTRGQLEGPDPTALRQAVRESWINQFSYKGDGDDSCGGLRTPQRGALHAIASHWTLGGSLATVVMPTGTGKTETMLSVMVSQRCECLLVVVPSRALRDQTAEKFRSLGVLKNTGNVGEIARLPVVGVLNKRPRTEADLGVFDRCNVVVAVIGCLAQGTACPLMAGIAEKCSHLILDEAHHVKAASWHGLRDAFDGKPVLQFTATPYREDRSPLDGQIIYDYPLHKAQAADLFKRIHFRSVFHTEQDAADRAIAERAIAQLKEDIAQGLDHRVMARCYRKARAEQVVEIYRQMAPELNPVLVISDHKDTDTQVASLRSGESQVVVCVNMLAEGFDLPELKIAAMHDRFKSLGITLQFVGRFTRVSPKSIGDATVIANTGDEEVAISLQRLYDEDPDWNKLIAELSFDRIEEEKRFLAFLQNAQPMNAGTEMSDDDIAAIITPQSIAPRFNAVVYRTSHFNPHGLRNGLEHNHEFRRGWISDTPNVAFFVTHYTEVPKWSKSRKIEDSSWFIYALYYSSSLGLLFINSSFSSNTNHKALAEAVTDGTGVKIGEEQVFRIFGGVNHLLLQQVGLLKQGPRNLRYSMFTGADVKDAINSVFANNAQKSNVFGSGYESGAPIGIGCSRKGKIWGRDAGPLQSWADWCDGLGTKLLDESIDVGSLIENALVPEAIEVIEPGKEVLFVDWPDVLHKQWHDAATFRDGDVEYALHQCRIEFRGFAQGRKGYSLQVTANDSDLATLSLRLSKDLKYGFVVEHVSGASLSVKHGKNTTPLEDFLSESPPFVYFTDQSQLEGNLLAESHFPVQEFPFDQLRPQVWDNVDHTAESWWKNGTTRDDAIQAWVMRRCVADGFDVVFDDDGSNEIADVVAIRENEEGIALRLVHCKYSHSADPGARVADIVEVASQATKNVRWFWSFSRLRDRMLSRGNASALEDGPLASFTVQQLSCVFSVDSPRLPVYVARS
jgi:superfamily II DNA or RNA helicase